VKRAWAFCAFVFLTSATLLATQIAVLATRAQHQEPAGPVLLGESAPAGFGGSICSVPAIGRCVVGDPGTVLLEIENASCDDYGRATPNPDGSFTFHTTPRPLSLPPGGIAIGFAAHAEPGESCIHVGGDRYFRLRLSPGAHEEFRRALEDDNERYYREQRAR